MSCRLPGHSKKTCQIWLYNQHFTCWHLPRNPPRDLNKLLEQAEAVEEGQGQKEAPTVALTEAIATLTAQLKAARLANVQAIAAISQGQVHFQDRSRPRYRDSSHDCHSSRVSTSNQRSYMPRDYSYGRYQSRGYENPRGKSNQEYSNKDRYFGKEKNRGYQQTRDGLKFTYCKGCRGEWASRSRCRAFNVKCYSYMLLLLT